MSGTRSSSRGTLGARRGARGRKPLQDRERRCSLIVGSKSLTGQGIRPRSAIPQGLWDTGRKPPAPPSQGGNAISSLVGATSKNSLCLSQGILRVEVGRLGADRSDLCVRCTLLVSLHSRCHCRYLHTNCDEDRHSCRDWDIGSILNVS